MRDNQSELCPKCRMPVTTMGSGTSPGTITQWLFICRCHAPEMDLPEQSLRICKSCGKAISEGRKGTFTQFIFRAEVCSCDRPEAPEDLIESMEARTLENNTGEIQDLSEEAELPVEEAIFPLERYKPLKELGSGAAGKVYLARDRLLGKEVAVKTLHQLTGEDLIAFQDEARATSLLHHDGIVKIIDFGVIQSGTPYMVLEYIPGLSLLEHLERHKTLPWQVAVDIFIRVVQSLDYAHSEGILHRDVKPSNIIIYTNELGGTEVKLIDFGVAQVEARAEKELEIQGRTIVGTPHYMSPDQAQGYTFTSQSDMYSVGCVMHECLTGSPPFSAETPLELLRLHAEEKIPDIEALSPDGERQEIPGDLERIIRRCLEKEPEDRYPSMQSLLADLNKLKMEALGKTAGEEEAETDTSPQKNKLPLYLVLGVLALAVVSFPIYNTLNSLEDVPTELKKKKAEPAKELQIGAEMEQFRSGPMLRKEGTLLMSQMGVVTPEDLKDIDFSRVEVLEFDFCEIKSPEVMRIFGSVPNLGRLIMPGGKGLSDEALSTFITAYDGVKNRNKKLYSMDLSGSDIQPGSMKYFRNTKTLRNLILDNTELNDEDMGYLANISLNSITLENTPITGAGLKKLAGIKSLNYLHLDRNSYLDSAAIKTFKKKRPDCIVRTWGQLRGRRTGGLPPGALTPP